MADSAVSTVPVPAPGPRRFPFAMPIAASPRFRWVAAAVGLLLLSIAIVAWARTRPSFDAFGWLTWGYQTINGTLDLGGAPSWKPLPWLFDTPFAVFGADAQLMLWMTTAVALALGGVAFAARATHRLCVIAGFGRWGALAGGAFAALALLGIEDYAHYILSVQSDPVIVACCLGGLDCHLHGRHRWALVLGVLAALGRPEVWPFLGLYAVWLWRTMPALRWWVVGGLAVVPALWFGVPEITNGRPFVAGQLALNSPRAPHGDKLGTVIDRFREIEPLTVQLLALAGVVLAVHRRDRRLLALVAIVLGWVVVEMAFALHGWAALPRYMFEAAAAMVVLAGVTIGWLVGAAARTSPGRVRLPAWSGAVVAAVVALTLVPAARTRVRIEHRDLIHERGRTTEIKHLESIIAADGGPHGIRRCGRPVTTVRFVSSLAWLTQLNVGTVGHHPDRELRRHHASVFFLPLADGWSVLPYHLRRRHRRACEALKASYIYPPGHSSGVRRRFIRTSFL